MQCRRQPEHSVSFLSLWYESNPGSRPDAENKYPCLNLTGFYELGRGVKTCRTKAGQSHRTFQKKIHILVADAAKPVSYICAFLANPRGHSLEAIILVEYVLLFLFPPIFEWFPGFGRKLLMRLKHESGDENCGSRKLFRKSFPLFKSLPLNLRVDPQRPVLMWDEYEKRLPHVVGIFP